MVKLNKGNSKDVQDRRSSGPHPNRGKGATGPGKGASRGPIKPLSRKKGSAGRVA